jgi:hypothetical protein
LKHHWFVLGLVLSCVAALGGCHPAALVLPPHLKTVGVSTFENKTSTYGLESLLTDQTILQFRQDGRLDYVSENKADLLVKATVTRYLKESILTDTATNRPKQYRLSVTYQLKAVDQVDGRTLFDLNDQARSVLYYTSDFPGALAETEEQAQIRLAEDTARAIVRKTLEDR